MRMPEFIPPSHPQWPPVPKKGAKSGKKPAANYLAEDDSEGDTSGEE